MEHPTNRQHAARHVEHLTNLQHVVLRVVQEINRQRAGQGINRQHAVLHAAHKVRWTLDLSRPERSVDLRQTNS